MLLLFCKACCNYDSVCGSGYCCVSEVGSLNVTVEKVCHVFDFSVSTILVCLPCNV